MSEQVDHWSTYRKEGGLLRAMSLLVGAVSALLLAVSPIAIWQQGTQGVVTSGTAALLCLLPAVAALGVTYRFIGTQHALGAMLGAMAFRIVPPLAVCLLLAVRGTGADFFPFICYLLLFYAATLAVETYLFVQLIQAKK